MKGSSLERGQAVPLQWAGGGPCSSCKADRLLESLTEASKREYGFLEGKVHSASRFFFTVLLGGSVEPAYLILGIYLLCSTPLSLLPTMLCKMRLTPLSVGPLLQSPCLQHPIMKGFWWCYLRPCPGRLLPCVYDQYVS